MKKFDICKEIKKSGLIASLDGDRVRIENPELLTESLRELIRNHHNAIVRKLAVDIKNPTSKLGELIERRKIERITYTTTKKTLNPHLLTL